MTDDPRFRGVRQASEGIEGAREALQSALFHQDIDLSVARSLAAGSALALSIGGNSLYVDQRPNSGFARIFYTPRGEAGSTPVTVYPGWIGNKSFVGLMLENDAQAGGTLRLIYGTDIDFRSSAAAGVTILNAPRAFPFDRNPLNKFFESRINNAAPHALTTRWTYTVPVLRKFMVGGAQTLVHGNTATAAAGVIEATILLTPFTGGGTHPWLTSFGSVVGVNTVILATGYQGAILLAGDIIEGKDGDTSTTTAADYEMILQGLEFDA